MFDLVKEAEKKYEKIRRQQESRRFKEVLGRLIRMKLLREREDIKPLPGPIELKDLLWAGAIEPRVLEVLPALILKKPRLIRGHDSLPEDLALVIKSLRAGNATASFRGIPPAAYTRWVDLIAPKRKTPAVLKSFRFQAADLQALALAKKAGYSETAAVREGLQLLIAKL